MRHMPEVSSAASNAVCRGKSRLELGASANLKSRNSQIDGQRRFVQHRVNGQSLRHRRRHPH